MPKRKTHEEFLEEFKNIHQNIILLEKYKYALEPILCKCLKDEYEWKARPSDLLKGKGCPMCAGNIKKTHEQFVKEMSSVNQNIEVLSEYKTAKSRISCRCKIDGHIWDATANNLLCGYGCPVCGKRMKMNHKQFIEKLYTINPDIEVIGTYVNSKVPILCKCKIDGNEWYGIPSALLSGRKCMKCAGKIKKTQEQFLLELRDINPNITVLGKYINYESYILCKCNLDGHEWYATPHNLLRYRGCPKCRKSIGERMVENYLTLNNIPYETQMKFKNLTGVGGKSLSYDFYLKNFNLLIEVQGRQHEKSIEYFGGEEQFKIQQEHDKRKREYAKKNNIEFIEIWYYEFKYINNILQSHLSKQVA